MRVKAQDKAAWDRLVLLYSPLILYWCRRAGLQSADSLDVGQEVFQAVWRGVSTFRREQPGESFRGWLRIIARSKIADWRRCQQAKAMAVGGSDALTLTQQVPAPELTDAEIEADSDRTEAALISHRAAALIQSEFQETTWLAFRAIVMDGRKPSEVAEELGVSANAIYLAKARVLKRLREEFEGLIDI